MKKVRISATSVPLICTADRHVRRCGIRGPVSSFSDVFADSLDGLAMRDELKDMIRRKLLIVIPYGFDDSQGRDPNRDRDQRMCGTSWSVNPTERLIRALWQDRITQLKRNRTK